MKFAGYKRAATDAEAKQTRARFREYLKEPHLRMHNAEMSFFKFDLMMGQRGLLQTMRSATQGNVEGVIVDDLKDLGRDLISLIKALDVLLKKKCLIVVVNHGLQIWSEAFTVTRPDKEPVNVPSAEGRMIQALASAHQNYVSQNRKRGIESAIAAGAQAGRPAGVTIEDVADIIDKMAVGNEGKTPSVRKVAKELVISIGKAHKLLSQWKQLRAAT